MARSCNPSRSWPARNYAPAEEALGENYVGTYGGAVDYTVALKMFEDAATQGDPNAMNDWGTLLDRGLGVDKDQAAAFKLYERAAPFAQANAMHSLATMFYGGIGTARDVAKAYYWGRLALRCYNPDKPDDQPKIAILRKEILPAIERALTPRNSRRSMRRSRRSNPGCGPRRRRPSYPQKAARHQRGKSVTPGALAPAGS